MHRLLTKLTKVLLIATLLVFSQCFYGGVYPEAVHADTDPPAETNIALEKTYTFSPNPNYGLCTDAGDATQLTDGKFVEKDPDFWTDPGAVGWARKEYIIITFDLEQDSPISEIRYSTGAGSSGVTWQRQIYVLVSDDGENYRLVGDLVEDNTNPDPPPKGTYARYIFKLENLNTHARYVKLVAFPYGYNFVDEVEIFSGGNNLSYSDPIFPHEDKSILTMLKFKDGTYSMIERLREKADSAGINLNMELGNIKNRVQAYGDRFGEIENFKTIIPFVTGDDPDPGSVGGIHLGLLALNARILRHNAFSGLVVWNMHRWDPLDVITSPPEGASPKDIALKMMNGERRGDVINLTNADDDKKTVTLNISGFGDENNPAWIKVYKVPCTKTTKNSSISDMIIELDKGDSGYELDIFPGMTEQLWLKFMPTDLTERTQIGIVTIDDSGEQVEVAIQIDISSYAFPDNLSLHLGMWDYMNKNPNYYDLNPENYDAMKKIVLDYKMDVFWGTGGCASRPKTQEYFDADGNFAPPPGYFDTFDNWVKEFPDAYLYCIFLFLDPFVPNTTFAGINAREEPELFRTRLSAWVDAFEDHLYSVGIEPKRVALKLVDEPLTVEEQETVINWAKPIRDRPIRYGSRIQIFENPRPSNPRDVIKIDGDDVYSCSDILCPPYNKIVNYNDEYNGFDFYEEQVRTNGKLLSFYIAHSNRTIDPYGHNVVREWIAYRYGAAMTHYWSLTGACGAINLNSYIASHRVYTPVYIDGPNVYGSKHFEAIFEGREDYEYLCILEKCIADLKDRHPEYVKLIEESENLLESAVLNVTAPVLSGEGTEMFHWSYEKDRSVADAYRDAIWDAIESISAILNEDSDGAEGDVNDDGIVDIRDLVLVARAFGSSEGDSNWNADADVNADGTVDLSDLVAVARNFGEGV